MKPVTIVAGIAVAAFAIDRIVSACLFLLSYVWKKADPASLEAPARYEAQRSYKLVYFSLAAILAIGIYVFFFSELGGMFVALGFPANHPNLDAFVATVVLVGGSERVSAFLKPPETDGPSHDPPPPIQIAGTLTLLTEGEAAANEKKIARGA